MRAEERVILVGRWREAVALLELAVRQNPASAERWYNLGSIYRLAGQRAKAREACVQALRLNPQDQESLRLRADLENDLKSATNPELPATK